MKYFLLLFIISLFYLLPLLNTSFYHSHDGEAHVARFAAYYKAFADDQYPPRWAGDLNSGYGSPLFIFFYPLPGYVASLLHFLGIELEMTFKIIIILSFILSPLFLFLWLKRFAKEYIAFSAAIIYMVLPYRFLDTYVRGDIAEILSFVFIPLIFLFIDKSKNEKKIMPIILGGILYALFILSHNAMAVIFSPVFIIYSIIFYKKPKDIIYSLGIFLLGILLAAFFWIPSIFEGKYVFTNLFIEDLYKDNFVSLLNLFYSPWGFGPDINKPGGLSAQIGPLYVAMVLLGTVFILIKRKPSRELIFWFFVFAGAVFMTTPYSKLLWEITPIIKLMGYPWRFTALSGFAACMIIFYILLFLKKKVFLVFFIILFLLFSLPFTKIKGYINNEDRFYYSYQGTTDYHMRTTTIWTAGEFWKKAQNQVEIIAGKGNVKKISRISNKHVYEVNAETDLKLLDNTVYFPGWKVFIDNKTVPIEFQDQNHRGVITFNVVQGIHRVEVRFIESPKRLLSDIISVLTFIFMVGIWVFKDKTKKIFA